MEYNIIPMTIYHSSSKKEKKQGSGTPHKKPEIL